MNPKLLATLIASLPELWQLLKALQKRIDEAKVDGKVKNDLKTISEAFHEKDAAKLNALFNSK